MTELLGYLMFKAKCAAEDFFTDERGDVNVVSIVILIAVAVVLAIVLKNALSPVIEDLVTKVGGKVDSEILG